MAFENDKGKERTIKKIIVKLIIFINTEIVTDLMKRYQALI